MTFEEQVRKCKTMPELDELRLDCLNVSKKQIEADPDCLNGRGQTPAQVAFIKQKQKLQRIPVKDRDW